MNGATPSDILLCGLIMILAFGALGVANPFRGVVMFIVFGLVMALAWTRLHAPDLALAEAALGAGVLGVLFLATLRGRETKPEHMSKGLMVNGVTVSSLLMLAVLAAFAGYAGVFSSWMVAEEGLLLPAYDSLAKSGVANPVTAVILNYRVYDTFLEIGVLFLVMLSVFALQDKDTGPVTPPGDTDSILRSYARAIVPLMVLAAGYLLWAGAFRPGGAFQAGAMLGGAGIMLYLSRPAMLLDMRGTIARFTLAAGFLSFCVLGVVVMLTGLDFLQWPPHRAKYFILAAETASTLSIGLTFTGLYAAIDQRLISPSVSNTRGKVSS
ncbi:MAG: DUF4040 domain-containing protein [Desulfofustis sp. PB-SRB1]|jgi:multisubunit Na+/H+ antiporter MnhB subunit|nr:DUF4040 domain-containing protein [Desulfofustis sp. PB-SRB1]MBM1002944.1 DUF4040 domain-containing protein [Desulfofustis sp. PB-SRB1]HBH27317.1 DUF4040 domain-containing protein [Desulfofustis sp.]HBH30958.1 DUF4040 domain-containing protein [Desulfofustis sp.]